ncbi:MAG TPA: hypothetical protein VND96_14015 [Candidatus Micrarchaeaceae archaeon]|nr:hypothetical protein [Candidatus Micrarchaeaceae archaeon]
MTISVEAGIDRIGRDGDGHPAELESNKRTGPEVANAMAVAVLSVPTRGRQ